jgi:plasmid replication initiation protein
MGKSKGTNESYEARQERLEKYYAEAEKNIHRKEITLNTDNFVVMSNNMILHSASNLSLNELKLLRFFIMQTRKDDTELFEFNANVKDIAKSLDINEKVLYRSLDKMTDHLMKEVIYIGNSTKDRWKKFHWVDVCEYEAGNLTIKLSDELKPFLIDLRGAFTRYQLSDIVGLNSVYAIRIYEILNGYMNDNNLPYADNAIEISVSIDTIRKATDTENKFERFSSFNTKVIQTAIKEINSKSRYHVIATPYKSGRQVVGFDFLIESQAGYAYRMAEEPKQIKKNNSDGQLTLEEFL